MRLTPELSCKRNNKGACGASGIDAPAVDQVEAAGMLSEAPRIRRVGVQRIVEAEDATGPLLARKFVRGRVP